MGLGVPSPRAKQQRPVHRCPRPGAPQAKGCGHCESRLTSEALEKRQRLTRRETEERREGKRRERERHILRNGSTLSSNLMPNEASFCFQLLCCFLHHCTAPSMTPAVPKIVCIRETLSLKKLPEFIADASPERLRTLGVLPAGSSLF